MRRGGVKGEIAVSSKESDGKRMLMGEIKKRPRLLLAFSLPPPPSQLQTPNKRVPYTESAQTNTCDRGRGGG